MKNTKRLVMLATALMLAGACTKDIDRTLPSNECSILDIRLAGQLGRADIARIDEERGTVTLYMFERSDFPWSAVEIEALALSSGATSDIAEGETLDFRNPERRARIVVRSQSGREVAWSICIEPYDPFYVGVWQIVDVKIYVDQNISGTGTGRWDTSMGGSEFGASGAAELDNRIVISMDEEMIDGRFTGRIINDAGPDGAYGSFLGVYPGEYTVENPLDMNPRLRHLLPVGESEWTLDLATGQMRIEKNNIASVMTFTRSSSGEIFFDFALPDASGDTPGNNFYNNFWRSSWKFTYIVRRAE